MDQKQTQQQQALAEGFSLILQGLGMEEQDHTKQQLAVKRLVEAWSDALCVGLKSPPPVIETLRSTESHPRWVMLGQIPVKSICSHHLLPFQGEAVVGYLPAEQICSLSALSKVVDYHARRPQLQEALTEQIVHTLQKALSPAGVGVLIRAQHTCMSMRGVNHGGVFTTTSFTGVLQDQPAEQQAFFQLANQQ